MRPLRGEWPLVAGLAVAVGLFGAAHAAGASGDEVHSTLRGGLGTDTTGAPAAARIDEVKGTSAVITVGTRRYTLAATSHTPRVGAEWRVALTGSNAGKPMRGVVRADALLNGSVARHIGVEQLEHGVYVVAIPWPEQSVGVPLALRFTIDDGSTSESLLYAVKVLPADG